MLRRFVRVLGGVASTTIVAQKTVVRKTSTEAAATGKAVGGLVPERTIKAAETMGGEQTVSLLRQAQPLQQQQAHQQQSMLAQPQQVQPSPPGEKRRRWEREDLGSAARSESAPLPQGGDPPAKSALRQQCQAQMPAQVTFKDDLPWPALYDPAAHFPKPQPFPAHLQFVSCRAPSGAATGPWCFAGDELRMVRQVYEAVWERYLEVLHSHHNRKGFLIIGHPGIGKTYLLDLLLSWHLFTHPQIPVVAVAIATYQVFIKVDGKTPKRFVIDQSDIKPSQFVAQLKVWGMRPGDPLVVLHDVKKTNEQPYKMGLLNELKWNFEVTCVVASSPEHDNWGGFVKEFENCSNFYLPLLSETEVRDFVANTHPAPVPSDATVSHWFYLVGGVPRHLTGQAAVDFAVSRQKLSVPKVEYDPVCGGTANETSAIVCMVPAAGYREARFDFVSDNACHLWAQHKRETDPGKLLKLLRAAGNDQVTRDVWGRFFEAWVISLVRSGSCLSRHPLRPGEPPGMLEPWALPRSLATSYYPVNDPKKIVGTTHDALWLPESAQFPVVNCVVVRALASPTSRASATLIQLTAASSHHPKLANAAKLFDALATNGIDVLDFVWIVYASSKLNQWQSLEGGEELPAYDNTPQFLCRVDDSMCWVRKSGSESQAVCFPAFAIDLTNPKEVLDEITKRVDPQAKRVSGGVGRKKKPIVFL